MRAPALGCALATLSLLASCGHSTARQVQPINGKHNLQIRNTTEKTVWVYVGHGSRSGSTNAASKGHVGEVNPGQTGYFKIERGLQKVYLRYRGEALLSRRSGRKFRLHFRTGTVHVIERGVVRTLDRLEATPGISPSPGAVSTATASTDL